jgi:hypothetical protein
MNGLYEMRERPFFFMKNERIHADERRFNNRGSSFICTLKPVFAPCWYEKKINNELGRTQYELTLPEFVSVRKSSLFFSGSISNKRFITDFGMRLYTPQTTQRSEQ